MAGYGPTEQDAVDAEVRIGSERVAECVVVVSVVGEIDMHAASTLRVALKRADEERAAIVVVDMTATTFIDSMTLGILVGAARSIRQRGGELRIACADRNITRIFELMLLDRLLAIYPSRTAALDALPRTR